MKHIPRKRFGQHFLIDAALIERIVSEIAPRAHQTLIEIGPGLGALTQPLLARAGTITVIEIDRDLAARWRTRSGVSVIESDVLKVDFAAIAAQPLCAHEQSQAHKLRVVGNLPYNISTPILFHLLPFAHLIEDQHFMLQKEVVQRMVAAPGTSDYGRLSVMLQWRYEMAHFLHVPPQAFRPPPRVDSAMVRMLPRTASVPLNTALFEELVKTAFSQRRKLLVHSLGPWLERHGYPHPFDLHRRAQEVPVDQYVQLAKEMSALHLQP